MPLLDLQNALGQARATSKFITPEGIDFKQKEKAPFGAGSIRAKGLVRDIGQTSFEKKSPGLLGKSLFSTPTPEEQQKLDAFNKKFPPVSLAESVKESAATGVESLKETNKKLRKKGATISLDLERGKINKAQAAIEFAILGARSGFSPIAELTKFLTPDIIQKSGVASSIKEQAQSGAELLGSGVKDIGAGLTTPQPITRESFPVGLKGGAEAISGVGRIVSAPIVGVVEETLKSAFNALPEGLKADWLKAGKENLQRLKKFKEENFDTLPQPTQEAITSSILALEGLGLDAVGLSAIKKVGGKSFSIARKGRKLLSEASKDAGKVLESRRLAKISILEDKLKAATTLDDVARLEREFAIELPASSTASPVASKVEQIFGEGLFGGAIKKRAENAIARLSQITDDIISKAPTSGELGEEIVKKFANVEKRRTQILNDLYTKADELAQVNGKAIKVDTKETVKFIKELLKRKAEVFAGIQDKQTISFLENLLKGTKTSKKLKSVGKFKEGVFSTETITKTTRPKFTNFKESLKTLGEKAFATPPGGVVPTTEKELRQLYNILKNDIDNAVINQSPELAATLKIANKEFIKLNELRKRPFAKTIKKLGAAGDVDTIADKLTKTKVSTNEIKQIYETIGSELTEKVQTKMIADIVKTAQSPNGGFSPAGFSKQLKAIGEERLKVLFKPQQLQLLKDIDKLNQLIAKGTAVARGSQTALVQQITSGILIRLVVATSTGLLSILGEFGLARFFGSAAGQRFLKGAVSPRTIKNLRVSLEALKTPGFGEKLLKEGIDLAPLKEFIAPKSGRLEGFIKPDEFLPGGGQATKAIPKELEPLAIEARKFKTADEFGESMLKFMSGNPSQRNLKENIKFVKDIAKKQGKFTKGGEQKIINDFINQALNNRAKSLQGTRFLFDAKDFVPLSQIDDLSFVLGVDTLPKSNKIKLFRGISEKGDFGLRAGDFLTPKKSLAKEFAGTEGTVKEFIVNVDDLLGDVRGTKPFELVFAPKGKLPKDTLPKLDFTDFFNQAKGN